MKYVLEGIYVCMLKECLGHLKKRKDKTDNCLQNKS